MKKVSTSVRHKTSFKMPKGPAKFKFPAPPSAMAKPIKPPAMPKMGRMKKARS